MHCVMHLLIYLCISVLILAKGSLQAAGEVFCAHESEDVILVWPKTPTDSTHNVVSRVWYKDNTAVASSPTLMEFYESPDYKDRLMRIEDIGIKLKGVTKVDSGNYTQLTKFGSENNVSNSSVYLLVTDATASVCKPRISHEGSYLKAYVPLDDVCAALKLEWKHTNKTQNDTSILELGTDSGQTEYMACAVGATAKCFQGNISDLCTNYTVRQHPQSGDGVTPHPALIAVSIMVVIAVIIVIVCFKPRRVICRKTSRTNGDRDAEDPLQQNAAGGENNVPNKGSLFNRIVVWFHDILRAYESDS